MSENKNITPFNGDKYNIWKVRVRALIDESISDENALSIIDNEEKPEDVSDGEWLKRNKKAKGIIIRNLSDSMVGVATKEPNITAREIFKALDGLYMRKSLATELATELKLQNFKFNENNTLSQHFVHLEELISDFEAASGEKVKESHKIARLLSSLPKSYQPLIVAIQTLSDENLTLPFVKIRLLEQEIQLKKESADTSAKVLQAININKPKKQYVPYKRVFNQKKKFFNNNKFKTTIKCHHCGRTGHIKANCYFYKKTLNYKNDDENRSAQIAEVQSNNKGFAFMLSSNSKNYTKNDTSFLVDSGASDHIINDESLFDDYIHLQHPIKIMIAKRGEYIQATKKGIVKLCSSLSGQIVLEDVLFCKEVPQNLLSVRRIQEAGLAVEFNAEGVAVKKDGNIILMGNCVNNVPIIKFLYSTKAIQNDYKLWHERLGHISKGKFLEIKSKDMFSDVDRIKHIQPCEKICEACINGKQAKLKFEKSKNREFVKRPLYIIHSDVCGPITPPTVDDKSYYVIFIDQFTHYCVTYLIKHKSDVFNMFKDFVAKSESHFNLKVVNLYIDNGREYLSNEMRDYCISKGISYHLTVPHTPELNGVSERMVRSVTEKARSMICGAKLDKKFWGEAVLTATYLINRSPSNALKNSKKTPYELWHGRKPCLKYLKVFGSTMYVLNKTRKSKFDEKCWKGILVGYEPNGYRLWDVDAEKFVTARDIVADETNMLTSRPVVKNGQEKGEETDKMKSVEENSGLESVKENVMPDENGKSVNENTDRNTGQLPQKRQVVEDEIVSLRRSKRIKDLPKRSYNENENIDNFIMSAETFINSTPNSFDEIENRCDKNMWLKAVQDELDSHEYNKTWSLVNKPTNKNIVDNRWVFTIKTDELGRPTKYKARLVARGFTQQFLTDYEETFAPVARVSSLRFILSLANQFNLNVHHMDVKTAFLNGILKEEIYMTVPQGLSCKSDQVCKLNKAIYGLKQAARCWFEVFDTAIKEKGFLNSEVDRCIYTLDNGDMSKNIYLLLYVDDLIIATADMLELNNFKSYLASKFQMTDCMEIKQFIGIRIERNNKTLTMSQSVYIKNVLNKFNMNECHQVGTPLPSQINYEALNSDDEYEAPCKNLIGCLMYITICTRPDLSAAINILSRYSNKNNKELWQCLKRVLRYLKGTIDLKLTYIQNPCNTEVLKGYVDADWGGNILDRKSTTGYLFMSFGNCLISWNTKKQITVATSTTEAEYMALFEGVKEALWLKSLARSVKLEINEPITLFEDNQSCISISNNPSCHKKTKHIDIKFHFSRDQVEKKTIKLEYIPTEKQLADIMTKSLCAVKFGELRNQLGLKK